MTGKTINAYSDPIGVVVRISTPEGDLMETVISSEEAVGLAERLVSLSNPASPSPIPPLTAALRRAGRSISNLGAPFNRPQRPDIPPADATCGGPIGALPGEDQE
jgi:hypothetical protein